MSAKASGSDGNSGSAQNRSHHDGSAGRAYTVDQKAAVLRVRRCSPTAFYDILGLESVKTTCSEGEIKKAYRKLSLLTHPDKNGYDGADEAFKMVARAFQILSDPDKKSKFDRFGGDPESRTASAPSGFGGGGFAGRPGGAGSSMFDDGPEISPEELFRQFFGGGMGGGGGFPFGGFDTGPQFVFNMGGPGGIRVTHFGQGGPRRRPRGPGEPENAETPLSNLFFQLLPVILLFIVPLLSSLFNPSSAAGPSFRMDKAEPPHTKKVSLPRVKGVHFWVNPAEYNELNRRQQNDLLHRVEVKYVSDLKIRCIAEQQHRQRLVEEAQGWFSTDEAKLEQARKLKMEACKAFDQFAPSSW